jgi:hypothetical protein
MRSGLHRVISRNGDPLFAASRFPTTPPYLPASDKTTKGDTTS